ncbi:Octanoyltransferase [Buchnera aphidicola (Takecallis arundicolens)]|uniref:lipoyl(octanoyl) transferase LipB n=1 Tax=Buchnera aphidicola TaxID=9 RepID=UPI003463EAC0
MNIFSTNFKKPYVIIRYFQQSSWQYVFDNMNYFTNSRNQNTIDEIWFVEHDPVYTQGQVFQKKNKKFIHDIPVIYANRGGKITYHGPGQQIVYLLLDLKRLKMNIRQLLFLIEYVVLNTLFSFTIIGNNFKTGIYVEHKKICSIGLRIKKYYSLHGFALNVNMDLTPFKYINPCGDAKIIMTQMYTVKNNISVNIVQKTLIKKFSLFFDVISISTVNNINPIKI